MSVSILSSLSTIEPIMIGLKLSCLTNKSRQSEATFKQGRHHFMTAVHQIMQGRLALEQTSKCLDVLKIALPFKAIQIFPCVIPMGVAYLVNRKIKAFHISQIASKIQNQLGNLSFVVTVVSTIALFILGQHILAATTLVYLGIGLLDRYQILPSRAQKFVRITNFVIGNVAGLYFGGHLIRLLCVLDLIIKAVNYYFNSRQDSLQKVENDMEIEDEMLVEEEKTKLSYQELQNLQEDTLCAVNTSHIHKNLQPLIEDEVKVEDILDIGEGIDWKQHESILIKHLEKDARWLEIGQYETTPIEYFKRNLASLILSIRDRNILEDNPESYEMLETYTRYIAQELKTKDELEQTDTLITLGIEGGEYCGSGKFQIIEEIYGILIAKAEGLSLEERLLACLQQERLAIWQNIYTLIWKSNPIFQISGYLTDSQAVHNANLFINLVQAGSKFGIPHQTAKNDQTAEINPLSHLAATKFCSMIEDLFWKGSILPQCYFDIDQKQPKKSWKIWEKLKLKSYLISPRVYDEKAILERLDTVIGTAQIPKQDVYAWWQNWLEKQQDLDEDQQEELSQYATLNGESLEINGKIRPKFIKAMLIEMGILNL